MDQLQNIEVFLFQKDVFLSQTLVYELRVLADGFIETVNLLQHGLDHCRLEGAQQLYFFQRLLNLLLCRVTIKLTGELLIWRKESWAFEIGRAHV